MSKQQHYFFTYSDGEIHIFGPYQSMSDVTDAGKQWQLDHDDDPRWKHIFGPVKVYSKGAYEK